MRPSLSSPTIQVALLLSVAACRPSGAENPDGWSPTAPRDEIAPDSSVERPSAGAGDYHLVLEGRGSEAVDGRWTRTVPVRAGTHYRFRAEYRAERVATPRRSILTRLVWLHEKGDQVGLPEYPETAEAAREDGWTEVSGTYEAPEKASLARLELHLRWSPRGRVDWRRARLEEVDEPSPRKVRLAAIHHRPQQSTPERNVERFGALVAEAAKREPDFICLPEGITVVGTSKTYVDVAEPIPGPTTKTLGKLAAEHNTHIVAGIYERDGRAVYNTCVLIGRDGALVGKYRKVCLPREEIDGGITPGTDFPVFRTDKGRVGLMICWDVHFPEVARELSARGAEVIFLPIWGGNKTLARARAIENQILLVASGYDFTTAVFDKRGQELVEASRDPEILVVDVDLGERLLWPWLGDWRSRIWREGPGRASPDAGGRGSTQPASARAAAPGRAAGIPGEERAR